MVARTRPPRSHRMANRSTQRSRTRSGTVSSSQTNYSMTEEAPSSPPTQLTPLKIITPEQGTKTPTHVRSQSGASRDEQSTPEPKIISKASTTALTVQTSPSEMTPTTPSLTPGAADDSDTDFQSAYSASPRGSYGSFENPDEEPNFPVQGLAKSASIEDEFGVQPIPTFTKTWRERVSSSSTATAVDYSQPSPTLSEDTINSRSHHSSKR